MSVPSSSVSTSRAGRVPRERSRLGLWAVLGTVLGLLVALLWFAPARWLAAGIGTASDGRVQLHDARGTVWNGSATLALTGGAGSRDQMALPGRMVWTLRPAWLGANLELLPQCCAAAPLQGQLRLGWQRAELAIAPHRSQWPSSLLQGLGAPFNTLQLDGELGLEIGAMQLQWAQGRSVVQGTVEAVLRNASSRLSTVRPLGSYRLRLRNEDASVLELSTDSGPLMLSGTGQWQGQHLRFRGEAWAAPEHLPALSNLLSLLGRRQGERAILNF